MTIERMDHVGIVVDDLAAATAFFVELGLRLQGEGLVEGGWVDRVVGLEGVRAEIAMLETPDGHGRLELAPASVMSRSPSTTSTPSSPACEPTARSSLARWSATKTSIGSATSAVRRGSSSNWRRRSANAHPCGFDLLGRPIIAEIPMRSGTVEAGWHGRRRRRRGAPSHPLDGCGLWSRLPRG
jgi:hypothetical protein